MKQLGFYLDVTKCTGCKTCAVACKDAHNLPEGVNLRTVIEYAGGSWRQDRMTGAWHQDVFAYYLSMACNHCEKPACVAVCPTKAHYKRDEDGLVVIDQAKCVGCGMCAKACPYDAPKLHPETKKMTKCDGCAERLAKGLQPICVESCTQRALHFGPIDELRKKFGENAAIAPLPSPRKTHPSLTIKAPENAKPVGDTSGRVFLR